MYKRKTQRDADAIKWQKDICKKIMRLRLLQRRSRVDVAVGADLNPNYYGRIERGMTGSMGMITLIRIKNSLEVKWSDLFDHDDPVLAFLDEIENSDKD